MLSLSIGHNVHGVATWTTADVCDAVAPRLEALGVEGFTAWACLGMYKGEREESTRLEIFDEVEPAALRKLLDDLCAALDQDEIYCNEFEPGAFYAGARCA